MILYLQWFTINAICLQSNDPVSVNLYTKRAKCFVALDKIKCTNGNIAKVIKHSKLKILNCSSFLSGLTNNLRLFGSCNALTTTRSNPLTTSTFSRGILCLCSISFLPLLCFYQRFFARETVFYFPNSFKYIYIYIMTFRVPENWTNLQSQVQKDAKEINNNRYKW